MKHEHKMILEKNYEEKRPKLYNSLKGLISAEMLESSLLIFTAKNV